MRPHEANYQWRNDYFGTDAHTFLKDIKKENWNLSYLFDRLREPISQLALQFYCNSQTNRGVQIESQEIHSIVNSFLRWMENEHSWSKIWQLQEETSDFDLYLELSRHFLRFCSVCKPSHDKNKTKLSGRRSLLNWPIPINDIKDDVLAAMSATTNSMPTSCRLEYQLHLEGLLDHEIAYFLGLEKHEVRQKIELAKELLRSPSTWRAA